MNNLLNKIKLIILPYLTKNNFAGNDYICGKIALSREIADTIDVVNDENLRLDKIDDGEIIFKQQMIGLPQSRMFRNDSPYLRLSLENICDIHLKSVPFVPDEDRIEGDAGCYEVIVRKVSNKDIKPKLRKAKRDKKEDEIQLDEGLLRQAQVARGKRAKLEDE